MFTPINSILKETEMKKPSFFNENDLEKIKKAKLAKEKRNAQARARRAAKKV